MIDKIILIALIILSAAPEHKKLRRKVRIYSDFRFAMQLAHFLSRPTNNAVQIATQVKTKAELVSLFGWQFLWEQPLQKEPTCSCIFWYKLTFQEPSLKIKKIPQNVQRGLDKCLTFHLYSVNFECGLVMYCIFYIFSAFFLLILSAVYSCITVSPVCAHGGPQTSLVNGDVY